MLAIYKKLVYNVFVIIKLKHYDRNRTCLHKISVRIFDRFLVSRTNFFVPRERRQQLKTAFAKRPPNFLREWQHLTNSENCKISCFLPLNFFKCRRRAALPAIEIKAESYSFCGVSNSDRWSMVKFRSDSEKSGRFFNFDNFERNE